MPLFWEAESMALIHVKRGAYGKVRPEVALAVSADSGRTFSAPVLGFLTEPVPRSLDDKPHPDLAKRARDLEKLDPGNVDRLVSFDPMIVPVAEQLPHRVR